MSATCETSCLFFELQRRDGESGGGAAPSRAAYVRLDDAMRRTRLPKRQVTMHGPQAPVGRRRTTIPAYQAAVTTQLLRSIRVPAAVGHAVGVHTLAVLLLDGEAGAAELFEIKGGGVESRL